MAELASCGNRVLPGQVSRQGDPVKHLGPPEGLGIPTSSRLFMTRCGLGTNAGAWLATIDDDDTWCPDCLAQAGIGYAILAV